MVTNIKGQHPAIDEIADSGDGFPYTNTLFPSSLLFDVGESVFEISFKVLFGRYWLKKEERKKK